MKSHRLPDPRLRFPQSSRAFTLLEILVSTVILSVLMLACATALDQTQRTWKFSQGKVEQFREARLAFEAINRHLAQATLNTYWDYFYPQTGSNEPPQDAVAQPGAYVRHSELQFRVDRATTLLNSTDIHPGHALFFQAPLGLSQTHREMGSLLNARGFYVAFKSDARNRPAFLTDGGQPEKSRFRLMEYRPPSERPIADSSTLGNAVYSKPEDWFRQNLEASSEPLADNILLLVVSPRVSTSAAKALNRPATWIAPSYRFNSTDRDNSTSGVDHVRVRNDGTADQGTQHLLPPTVQITLVAIDEPSAQRLLESNGDRPVDLQQESGASFSDALQYDEDLSRIKRHLTDRKLNFRVFTSTVIMRNARWDGRE